MISLEKPFYIYCVAYWTISRSPNTFNASLRFASFLVGLSKCNLNCSSLIFDCRMNKRNCIRSMCFQNVYSNCCSVADVLHDIEIWFQIQSHYATIKLFQKIYFLGKMFPLPSIKCSCIGRPCNDRATIFCYFITPPRITFNRLLVVKT